MQNVIQKYYSGLIKDEDLLDELEIATMEWHNNAEEEISLHVFLGMCIPEYELWVTQPSKFMEQIHYQSYHPRFWNMVD